MCVQARIRTFYKVGIVTAVAELRIIFPPLYLLRASFRAFSFWHPCLLVVLQIAFVFLDFGYIFHPLGGWALPSVTPRADQPVIL